MLDLHLILLLAKVDYISEKQDYKKDAIKFYSIGHIKKLFALSAKKSHFIYKFLLYGLGFKGLGDISCGFGINTTLYSYY